MIPMNVVLNSGVVTDTQGVVGFLAASLVKGAGLLLCSALLVLLLRRASAAVRHLIWTIGVAGVLVLPPLAQVLPAWGSALPVPVFLRSPDAFTIDHEPEVLAALETPVARAPAVMPPSAAPLSHIAAPAPVPAAAPVPAPYPMFEYALSEAPFDWARALVVIWLTGMFLGLAGLAFSYLRVFRLQRRATHMRGGPCVAAVYNVAARIGLTRIPRVLVGSAQDMPMVWGIFRPVLLLPLGAAAWPRLRLESVILHELAHVRRRDALTQLLAELARAIYWFNPLVWVAARRMYIEREHACDDIVLNAGTRASDYAGELLDLVRSLRTTRATALAAIAMARPSQLSERLEAVLDEERSRGTLTRAFAFGIAFFALALVVPLAALDLFGARARADMPHGVYISQAPLVGVRALEPLAALAPRPPHFEGPIALHLPPPKPAGAYDVFAAHPVLAYAEQQEWCASGRNNSISHSTDDGIETIKWSRGRCSGSARIEGAVVLTDDFTGIARIAAGGLFRIEEDDGDVARRLDVRPLNGRLEYTYRVNGRAATFDETGREWLGAAIVRLTRMTGFAADQRVDQLLRTSGVNGVLGEVADMSSDYVQSVYLRKLLDKARLSPAEARSTIDLAAHEIESDYELARVLMAVSDKHTFTDETRAAFIAATASIESDYEQRRVLAATLARGGLGAQDVTAMIKSSQNIGSDYERATLLLSLAERYQLDPAMRAEYLRAAQGIRSDYEQRRVYANLIKQSDLSTSDLAELLKAAATIRSDYEKAQVLTELAGNDLSDATLQRAFLDATRGLTSSYEHRRVLAELLKSTRLSAANLEVALQSAAEISSDYELAQVLMMVLQNHTLNERQRALFMKALNTIDSRYEYGRVASALLRKNG